jgi:hypothetical protein
MPTTKSTPAAFWRSSGVLEVITPVKKENGERETDDLGDDVFERDFFAQGEWIRVYDGPPKVSDR